MRTYRFDPGVGKEDGQFGSVKAVISKVLHLDERAQINALYIHPNERISVRQAITQQLVLLVEGEGWLESETVGKLNIMAGQAVMWENDESGKLGTESGMTAVIIGNIHVDPAELIPPLQEDKS